MLFSEIYGAVQDSVDDTSAAGLVRIKRYINWGQQDLASRKNGEFLRDSSTLSLAAGTEEYALPATVDKLFALRDTTNNKYITRIDYKTLIENYPDPSETTGLPQYWYNTGLDATGNVKIKFYPVPDSVATINYDYYKRLTDLSADGSTPIIPARYHQLLVDFALWHWFEKEQDPQANYYATKYENGIEKMLADVPEVDMPTIKTESASVNTITGKIGRVY